jgi:hypothetical protein
MDDNDREQKPLDTPSEGVDLNEQDTSEEVVVKTISTEHLAEVVRSKNKAELDRIFSEVADIDIAEAADGLDVKDLIVLFRDVNSQQTAPLFDDLSQDKKEELVRALTDKDLVKSSMSRRRTILPIPSAICQPTSPSRSSMPPIRTCGPISTRS